MTSDSDASWQAIGNSDPYFGVLSDPKFHRAALNDEAANEFFASGEQHAAQMLAFIEPHAPDGFALGSALDFGCGVGRVAIPLARHFDTVTGIDVSTAMLDEAARNAQKRNVANLRLLSAIPHHETAQFDFIHSFIVFQHIPPSRGIELAMQALCLLAQSGVAVLHFTFARTTSAGHWRRLARHLPFSSGIYNVVNGRPFNYPRIDMHCYDLNKLFRRLHAGGFRIKASEMVVHGDSLGVILAITASAATRSA
jgi:SAM-dependent methyltransferase